MLTIGHLIACWKSSLSAFHCLFWFVVVQTVSNAVAFCQLPEKNETAGGVKSVLTSGPLIVCFGSYVSVAFLGLVLYVVYLWINTTFPPLLQATC